MTSSPIIPIVENNDNDKAKDKHFCRKTFPGIGSRTWEHPSDRAALTTLRKVPGFDLILRKMFGMVSERSLRLLYMGNAVRVGPRQFPKVYHAYCEALRILDVETQPELFVAQTPLVNAGAVGLDNPFIVLNSGLLSLMDEDELLVVLGHELGHILSGHALYKTMLRILLRLTMISMHIPLGGLALTGVIMGLLEWDRKSELSADRAGLLVVQNPDVAYRVKMRLAGGGRIDEMNLDDFVSQSNEYECGGDSLDAVVKLLNLLHHRHPFPVLRLSELQKWVASGAYGKALAGEYEHRKTQNEAVWTKDAKEAAGAYSEKAASSFEPVFKFVRDAANKGLDFVDKYANTDKDPPPPTDDGK